MQTIVLDGYAQVRDAYRSRDLEQALYDAGGVVMADSLLVLHGDAHRRRRRVENRLFRPGVFAEWERTFLRRTVFDALAPSRAAGGADLVDLGYRTVTTLTALVAGIDLPSDGHELVRFARTFSEGATVVHTTRDPDAVRAEVRAALDEFGRRFLAPSIARRSELLRSGGELPQDVLTALLRHRDELGLDDATILRETAFYLQAGSHSSVDAFAHAVDDLFSWTGGDPSTLERVRRDRPLLQRCVHETLRLHPASPVARRRALADVRLRDGTLLPAGATVELDVAAANRDPGVFDRPDVYDPDRSVPAGVARWGHAFGGGMHACIGTELAGGVPGAAPDDAPVGPEAGQPCGADDPAAGHAPGAGGPEAGRVRGVGGPEAGRVLGTVTMMLAALLDAGGRPDPDDPPLRDPHSARDHFARYPVLLTPPA